MLTFIKANTTERFKTLMLPLIALLHFLTVISGEGTYILKKANMIRLFKTSTPPSVSMRTISVAYYGRGLAHSSLGDESKARADFNKALELGHDRDEVEAALKRLDGSG